MTLGGTEIYIDTDITIEGPGAGLLTIDANNQSPGFPCQR